MFWKIFFIFLFVLFMILFSSCKKECFYPGELICYKNAIYACTPGYKLEIVQKCTPNKCVLENDIVYCKKE